MPHNVLISKIRCYSPNKKSSASKNKNSLIYIATRPGTDISLTRSDQERLNEDMSDPKKYMKYIHERPRSHGLFGNLDPSNLDDLNKLGEKIYQLSKTKNIYRSIISLDKNDALELGYVTKDKWDTYLRSVMPDVGKEFAIPIHKLQWVAAFHAEDSHPHVHVMFWREDDAVRSPYIHTHTQNACRQLLSRQMFADEYYNNVAYKTASRNSTVELGKSILDEEISNLVHLLPSGSRNQQLLSRIDPDQLSDVTKDLIKLISVLPGKGSLKYKYLPPAAKEQLDKIVARLIDKKELHTEYNRYQQHVQAISATYSASTDTQKQTMENAMKDLNKRLGNMVLKSIKPLMEMQSYLTESIDYFATVEMSQKDFKKESIELYTLGKASCDQLDFQKGLEYLEASAKLGNDYAMLKLGTIYLWGIGSVEKNVDIGNYWLTRATGHGNEYAKQMQLAHDTFRMQYAVSTSYTIFNSLYLSLIDANRDNQHDTDIQRSPKKALYKQQNKYINERNEESR